MDKDTIDSGLSIMDQINKHGIVAWVWVLIISAWAGTVRYLSNLEGAKPKLMEWIIELLVSGFVGVLTAMICQHYEMDFFVSSAIIGVSAHNGTRSLYLVSEVLRKSK